MLFYPLDKIQQPYDDKWSCPIPPKENRLKVRIEAGEKTSRAANIDAFRQTPPVV